MKKPCSSLTGRAASFTTKLLALLACPALLGGLALAQTSTTAPKKTERPLPTTAEVTKPVAAKSDADTSETVQLSPFVVNAEEDTGYRATSTLAGTRLRTDLKDLSASISVVTKDFMNDVNATDMTSLLVYTLGTEIGGYGGNFSAISDATNSNVYSQQLGQLTPTNRVRGLSSADATREYFGSGVPFDSYNVDRVEINRGANAILFGLGSPAGIINTSIIKANTRKNKTTVSGQYGSYGSYRGTLDLNQVLIQDKLAVRVATVVNDTKYRVEDAYYMNRGITATVTYQPFKDTTFRLTHEHGSTNSTKAQIRPPYDWYTWWWPAGKPVWDPTTGTGRLLGTPQAPFTASGVGNNTSVFAANGTTSGSPGKYLTGNFGGWRGSEIGLFYQNPNSGNLGGVDIGGGKTVDGVEAFTINDITTPASPNALTNGGMVGINHGQAFISQVYQGTNPFSSLYTQEPQITDPKIFDFYHSMMGGPSQYEWGEWQNTNLSFDQTFFNHKAGISIVYQKESTDYGFVAPSDYQLTMDVNEKLPNGVANPNFLRPVMANFGSKSVNSGNNEAYRIEGFYDLDLRKVGPSWLGKILGHHLFQGNYMAQESANESLGGFPYINNYDYVTAAATFGLPANANGNSRIVSLVNYLGPSAINAATPEQAPAQGLTVKQDPSNVQTVNILYHHNAGSTPPATPWTTGNFGLINDGRYNLDNTVSGASRSDLQVHSLSSAIQSYWLDDTLVSTLGFRTDRVWTFSAGGPAFTSLGVSNLNWDTFHPTQNTVVKDSSTTWGVVGHLPKFIQRRLPLGTELSAFYNHADNFSVSSTRYTLLGTAIDPQGGNTREYGVSISTFNGKLDLKVAHYETVSANNTVSTLNTPLGQMQLMADNVITHDYAGDNQTNPTGITQFENWLKSANGQIYTSAFGYTYLPNPNTGGATPPATFGNFASTTRSGGRGVSAVSDVKSTGYEFEVTYNPVKNWRITANASRTEAVRTNIAPEFKAFVFAANGLVSLVQNPDGSATAAGSLIGSIPNQTTAPLRDWVFGNIINQGVVTTFAQSGTASNELRKWSGSLVTNYTFDSRLFGGRLNGFSVGGAMRWQDKGVIGYGGAKIVSNGNTIIVSDVNQPRYGPIERIYDLWFGYEHKLSHGINWKVQLNIKNVGVGNELIPQQSDPDGKVVVWRIKEPQKWTLTNTFEF